MFKTEIQHTPTGIKIKFLEESRRLLGISKKFSKTDFRAWKKATGASGMLAYFEIRRIQESEPDLITEADGVVTFHHKSLSKLSNNALKALGLPINPDFQFTLRQRGSLATSGFRIEPVWASNTQTILTTRRGVFLRAEGQDWTIPEPIYKILKKIDEFNAQPERSVAERMDFVAYILDQISQPYDDDQISQPYDDEQINTTQRLQVKLEGALDQFRVRTARAFSISVEFKNRHGYKITPVLFGQSKNGEISEEDGLLNDVERTIFECHPTRGFFSGKTAKRTYLLESGEYILLDEILLPAIERVRSLEDSPPQEREEFARNPIKALGREYQEKMAMAADGELDDQIQEEELENLISNIFVETEEYSDRVIRLGLWEPPVLPWIKRMPNSWEPEEFGIYLDKKYIVIPPDKLCDLRKAIDQAIENNQRVVDFEGSELPATKAVAEALRNLIPQIKPSSESPNAPPPPNEHVVLVVRDNFEEEQYQRQVFPRQKLFDKNMSPEVLTPPMDHQKVSIDWQIEAYLSGLPGILNADDQGLGKTFQTLAFMAWLQENMKLSPERDKKPILVVAPTTLLGIWSQEAKTHIKTQFGLGSRIDAYGSPLRKLKRVGSDGVENLDFGLEGLSNLNDKLIWILTTYTTLAKNQVEFGKVDFGLVVFDEIQAIKNPATLVHRAAQSLKADFQIGLTGTPIENSLSELWAIMDVIVPGSFGSLKAFMEEFNNANETQHRELHNRLFDSGHFENHKNLPALGIRRMKSETVANLPQKRYRFYSNIMPSQQAQAYDTVFLKLKNETRGRALKILHQLRSVSLYPDHLQRLDDSPDPLNDLIEKSARMKQTMRILTELKERGEKVLLFLETHQMQYILQRVLSQHFELDDIPIINGKTSSDRRGKIVNDFQKTLGDGRFDIRILSPKSAGVGITMTAATNVIHLSRWWNPAVEEQCNDRVYRIGQECDVTIHIPMAVHPHHQQASFDCILNDIMIRKRNLFRDILMPAEDHDADQNAMIQGLINEQKFDLSAIDRLDWKAFEKWARDQARASRVWRVSDTPNTGDGGLDIHLEHLERGDVVLVQCKFTNQECHVLNENPVREILHAVTRYQIKEGSQCVVITNAEGFSNSAQNLADKKGVILVDRQRLALWPKHII